MIHRSALHSKEPGKHVTFLPDVTIVEPVPENGVVLTAIPIAQCGIDFYNVIQYSMIDILWYIYVQQSNPLAVLVHNASGTSHTSAD